MKKYILPIFLTFLGIVLSYVLFKPKTNHLNPINLEQKAAVVLDHAGLTEYKAKNSAIWESLPMNNALYVGDYIKTGPDSKVSIKLANNGVFELTENGILAIDNLDKGIGLQEGEGFLRSSSEEDMKVLVGGKEVTLAKSSVVSFVSSHENVDLKVFQGQMTLGNQMVESGQQVNFKGDGKTQITQQPFILTSPLWGEQIFQEGEGSQKVAFNWRNQEGMSAHLLKWGKNKNQLDQEILLEGLNDAFVMLSEPGKYYWQVEDSSGVKSSVYSFEVVKIVSPQITSPLMKARVQKDNKILVSWLSSTPYKNFKINLFKSNGELEQDLLVNSDTRQYFVNIDAQEKEHSLKIIGILPSGNEVSSNEVHFEIVNEDFPYAPILLEPSNNSVYPSSDSGKGVSLTLKWERVENATHYNFVLFKDGISYKNFELKENSFNLTDLENGKYEWKVQTFASQTSSAFSDSFYFSVGVESSSEFKVSDSFYDTQIKPIAIVWPANNLAQNYTIKIYKQDKMVDQITIKNNSYKFSPLDDGNYRVLVEGLDKDNKIIVKNNSNIFKSQKRPLLKSPNILCEQAIVGDKNGMVRIVVSTNHDPAIKSYIVDIFDKQENNVYHQISNDPFFQASSLSSGEYNARVRGIEKSGRETESSSNCKVIIPGREKLLPPGVKTIKVK